MSGLTTRKAATRVMAVTMTTTGAAGIMWCIYDYNTCHPMRKMRDYNLSESFIRFHNTYRPKSTYPTITLNELSTKYSGGTGIDDVDDDMTSATIMAQKKVYFSSDGNVWDVSTSKNFNETYKLWRGKDATVALAIMSMDPKDVNRTDWDDLTEKEIESLHSWTKYFNEKYIIKGKLKEYQNSSLS